MPGPPVVTPEPDTTPTALTTMGAPRPARPGGVYDGTSASTPLPTDVMADAGRRLRVVALVYAAVFSTVGPVTALLSPSARVMFFDSALRWGPSLVSIAVALAVVAATRSQRLAARHILVLGLVFEVAGSYGIASARYLAPVDTLTQGPVVSWVAVWMLVFATVMPSPPRLALAAALASATAVPVVASVARLLEGGVAAGALLPFALRTFVPYLVVALVASVAARVVYRLGTALTRARELGSYRLVERLAQGGMGEVWRADHHFLARPAAIKLIRPPGGDASARDLLELKTRFEREAQITSTLRSAHTINLYDFGVTDDGAFYYVMELLDGFDLQTLVERFGPLPEARAIHFLRQVCDSLAEAHALDLVHRDVKPANVFVCRYGRQVDVVKVLDFGLAKPVVQPHGPTEMRVSGTHAARGTPAFMAPEQAMGDRPVDGRTDIYALGCLAFWLVTGRPVFQGQTALETIVRHVQAVPDPPSAHTTTALSSAFDQLVLACLAKDPAARPQTADALDALLGAVPTASLWRSADAHAWWASHQRAG